MAKSGKRLGRGLGSLIGTLQREMSGPSVGVSDAADLTSYNYSGAESPPVAVDELPDVERWVPARQDGQVTVVRVDQLVANPFQPRADISDDKVAELAASIQANGIVQPIVARPQGERYQIIAGERRWRAARLLKRESVPVIVRDATDEQMLELALVENIQREDLNPIDRASAYRQYCDRFGLGAEQVAERTGEDRSTVVNYLRLLELPEAILRMTAEGRISMGHARCLLALPADDRRIEMARAVERRGISVRMLEKMVQAVRDGRLSAEAPRPAAGGGKRAPILADLESRFEEALKTKVTIKASRRKHRGRIVIEYYSLDDFDRIAERLGVALD